MSMPTAKERAEKVIGLLLAHGKEGMMSHDRKIVEEEFLSAEDAALERAAKVCETSTMVGYGFAARIRSLKHWDERDGEDS